MKLPGESREQGTPFIERSGCRHQAQHEPGASGGGTQFQLVERSKFRAVLICDLAQRDERAREIGLCHSTRGDLDQLTRGGREEAQSAVLRNVQANARAVRQWLIGSNEGQVRKLFEATRANQSVT